jgi:hypothetical protein
VDGPTIDRHHLIPRSHGGTDVVLMHRICHTKIHSVLRESELADWYHTVDRLLGHPEIAKFVRWVRKQDPARMGRHRKPRR